VQRSSIRRTSTSPRGRSRTTCPGSSRSMISWPCRSWRLIGGCGYPVAARCRVPAARRSASASSRAKLLTEAHGASPSRTCSRPSTEAKQDLQGDRSSSCAIPASYSGRRGAFRAACSWSGRPAPARLCWRAPSRARPMFRYFTISGSDFVEMFVGVGASRVRDMFEQGQEERPLHHLPRRDRCGWPPSRRRPRRLATDESEQTLNQLLVENGRLRGQ